MHSAPRTPHSLLLVGLTYAAFVSLGLPDGLTGVAWPSIRATFTLPLDALGALVTTSTIGYLTASFASGRMLARLGVGGVLVLSSLATVVSLLGYSLTPLWSAMVWLGLLAGLGAGAVDAGLNTYAAENFSPRTMNWLHASFGLGAATGPVVMASVLSAELPWRVGYGVVGAAQLLLTASFMLTRNQWQANRENPLATTTTAAPMLRTLRLPSVWLSIFLFFLYTGLEFAAGQWLYSLLTEARGVAPAPGGAWVSMYWGSLMAGRLLSGMIVARITVRLLLQLAMSGALLGVLLLWLNLTSWLALTGVVLLGGSLAPMFPTFMSLTPQRVGAAHAANAVGFQVAAAMLGGAALVSGFGVLAGQFGLETLGPFLLTTAVLLTLVSEVLERQARKASPREEREN